MRTATSVHTDTLAYQRRTLPSELRGCSEVRDNQCDPPLLCFADRTVPMQTEGQQHPKTSRVYFTNAIFRLEA